MVAVKSLGEYSILVAEEIDCDMVYELLASVIVDVQPTSNERYRMSRRLKGTVHNAIKHFTAYLLRYDNEFIGAFILSDRYENTVQHVNVLPEYRGIPSAIMFYYILAYVYVNEDVYIRDDDARYTNMATNIKGNIYKFNKDAVITLSRISGVM